MGHTVCVASSVFSVSSFSKKKLDEECCGRFTFGWNKYYVGQKEDTCVASGSRCCCFCFCCSTCSDRRRFNFSNYPNGPRIAGMLCSFYNDHQLQINVMTMLSTEITLNHSYSMQNNVAVTLPFVYNKPASYLRPWFVNDAGNPASVHYQSV